ncbi:MAG: non-reducing end alpha-L-arabinofuranosidase family hydrolase [Planctomycetota bacterium]
MRTLLLFSLVCLMARTSFGDENSSNANPPPEHAGVWDSGEFRWRVQSPLISVTQAKLPSSKHDWVAVKDPSVVRFEGHWHLFCTLRKNKQGDGRIRIGCCRFKTWTDIKQANWSLLDLTLDYHAAPQIFYFEPHKKWYLVYQATDPSRGLKYGPCYSVTDSIDDPTSWTKPKPFYVVPEGEKAGLDFWVICDDSRAYLFFTSLDGRMWQTETELTDFPDRGWSKQRVVLKADIFEASHTYKLRGEDRYVTLVEAKRAGRRCFKLFIANQLRGPWKPLAASRQKPAVSIANVINQQDSWATSYSHGEFIRSGYDQRLEIDPSELKLLFQGANDQESQKGGYGDITWRLGILKQVKAEQANAN